MNFTTSAKKYYIKLKKQNKFMELKVRIVVIAQGDGCVTGKSVRELLECQ